MSLYGPLLRQLAVPSLGFVVYDAAVCLCLCHKSLPDEFRDQVFSYQYKADFRPAGQSMLEPKQD